MIFKKQIALILSSLILFVNLGLHFSVHYCKDEIASISFQFQNNQEPCAKNETSYCAKETSHEPCCSNKIIKIEKNTDDILVKSIQLKLDSPEFITYQQLNFIPYCEVVNSSNEVAYYCDSHAPPLYKFNCQLIFYA